MLILRGATCLCLGGLGTLLGVESSTRDENQIFMLVEGNLRTHLLKDISTMMMTMMMTKIDDDDDADDD